MVHIFQEFLSDEMITRLSHVIFITKCHDPGSIPIPCPAGYSIVSDVVAASLLQSSVLKGRVSPVWCLDTMCLVKVVTLANT